MRLRIVEPEREAFDMSGGAVGFKLFELRPSVPNLARNRGAIKLNPCVGSR